MPRSPRRRRWRLLYTNPLAPATYVGVCDPANPIHQATFVCNDKLIGAWTWPATNASPDPQGIPSPADDDEHGSHTASTTAGNVVTSTISGVSTGTVSGVAAHANIIAYDACNTGAGCPTSALVASIDQAAQDGVDVINYRSAVARETRGITLTRLAFLNAMDAGVLALTSAGNDGPDAGTLGAPSNSPWVISVAQAPTIAFVNRLTNMTGGATTPPADMTGKGFSGPSGYPDVDRVRRRGAVQ